MNKKTTLMLGDILAIAALAVIGFAMHGEGNISFIPRMGTTFFPLLVSWFLLAPWFGLFEESVTVNLKSLWRVPFAVLLAAPLTSILRAAMLGNAALPLFTLILGFTSALGLCVWRVVYIFIAKSRPGQPAQLY